MEGHGQLASDGARPSLPGLLHDGQEPCARVSAGAVADATGRPSARAAAEAGGRAQRWPAGSIEAAEAAISMDVPAAVEAGHVGGLSQSHSLRRGRRSRSPGARRGRGAALQH